MVEIRKLQIGDDETCGAILRRLPQWFGIESAIQEYEANLRALGGYSTNGSGISEEV